jgi:transposase
MTVYCAVDFHARKQFVSYCDTMTGEIKRKELHHLQDDLRGFYSQLPGQVIVGMEASGYAPWFEALLAQLGHQIWVGDAAEIRRRARRRQKNDQRDADLMLDLMLKDEFPRLHRHSLTASEVLRALRYRHKLVRMRTMVKNSMQALAISAGLPIKKKLFSREGRLLLLCSDMTKVMVQHRDDCFELLEQLDLKIKQIEKWLNEQAKADARVERLRTHPGLGLLSALAVVNFIEPVSRFSTSRKVVAFAGLDPVEDSSGDRKRYLSISKQGSRLLRFLLVEAAHSAIKSDEQLRTFYWRIAKRRNSAKAAVAVARKLLMRAYIMLRDGIDYEEFTRRGVLARSARD